MVICNRLAIISVMFTQHAHGHTTPANPHPARLSDKIHNFHGRNLIPNIQKRSLLCVLQPRIMCLPLG